MYRVSIYLIFTFLLVACSSKDDASPVAEVVLSAEKELLNFEIANLETEIIGDKILIYTSASALDFNFNPTYSLSEFATIKPEPTTVDYTESVSFEVTAENGEVQNYTTEIIKNNGLEEIKFIYELESGFIKENIGVIDEKNKTIIIEAPKETIMLESTLSKVEIITVGGLSTDPATDTELNLDFNTLSVYNTDGTEDIYSIEFLNYNNVIGCLYLNLLGEQTCGYQITQSRSQYYDGLEANDIVFQTLESEDITELMVSTEFTPIGISFMPSLENPIDLSNDMVFSKTTESGFTSEFKVRVIKSKIFFINWFTFSRQTIDNDKTFNSEYYATSEVVKVDLYNEEQDKDFPCTILENFYIPGGKNILSFDMNEVEEANKGLEFKVRVELASGESILTLKTYVINE